MSFVGGLLFVILLVAICDTSTITIVDPHCTQQQQYGTASSVYNIIGSHITVSLNFTSQLPTYSCYLCDAVGIDYCNATIGNVLLSNELIFNVMTVVLTTDGEKKSGRSYNILRNDPRIVVDTPTDLSCAEPLHLIVLAFATIQNQSPMVFLTVLQGDNNNRIVCNESHLLFDDIDCSVIGPYYYYLPIDRTNCINADRTKTTLVSTSTENNRPFLYWYKESFSISPTTLDLKWCHNQIDWLDLLQQSNLSFLCGTYAPLYVALKPWYHIAIEYTTARLNMIRNPNPSMTRTMSMTRDYLERTCLFRDTTTERMNDTIFGSLYDKLSEFNRGNNRDEISWCREIAISLNRTDMDEGLIPYYLALYKEWYFQYFSFFILYAEDMEVKVLIALVLISIAFTIFLLSTLVVPTWMIAVHCYRRMILSRFEKNPEPVHFYEL